MTWKNNILSLVCLFALGIFYYQTTIDITKEKLSFDENWSNLRHDAGIYYAYLPATFIKKDPLFKFLEHEPSTVPEKGIQYWVNRTEKGGWVPKMTMGKAFLDIPFFWFADIYVKNSDRYERTGFSLPYKFAIAFSTLFYTFLGLFFLRLVLLKFFSDTVTTLTLLLIALATNLFHYSTHETGYTHPHNFFMLSALIYLSIRWHEKRSFLRDLSFGLLCGLVVLVRPVNIFLLLPLPFFSIYFSSETSISTSYIQWIKTGLKSFIISKKMLTALIAALVIVSPQLIFWKIQSGSWMHYSYNDEGFFWSKPHIIDGLFSFRKGWFVYTPIMLFASLGLIWFFKKQNTMHLKLMGFGVTVTFFIFLYVTFSWWCWWYGGGFGARTMIDFFPFMAFGLAGFIAFLYQKNILIRLMLGALILFTVKLNTFQTNQYHLSLIHWDSMTYEAYKAVFFNDKFPENFQELMKEPNYQKQKETGNE